MSITVTAKNLHSTDTINYPGWSLTAGQEVELTRTDVLKWRESTSVIDAINNDILQIGNGETFLVDHAEQLNHLFFDEIITTTIGSQPAFAAKNTIDGKKLFRRKHGFTIVVPANSSNEEQFTVPYIQCKINEMEVIGASLGDSVDLNVYDTSTGLISTIPDHKLNQFGHGVYLSEGLYRDKSEYDADLIFDMKIGVKVNNSTSEEKTYYINIVLHELKS